MRQWLKYADANASYGSLLVCVVLICGALFGIAAEAGLLHLGLDFGSVRDDLIVGAAAHSRSALAWWAWWLFPLGAFFVGPLTLALMRWMVANWWWFRPLRFIACATAVVALAMVGRLPSAPTTLDARSGAVASLVVVVASTLLAWLGACLLGNLDRGTTRAPGVPVRRRVAISATPPRRGGGSAAAGAPFVRRRQPHALVARCTLGHLALAATLGIAVCAAVIGMSGATIVVEHAMPGDTRQLLAWSGLRPYEPPFAGQAIGIAALVPRTPVADAEAPGMMVDGTLVPESELTFVSGYRKRQAVLAAQRASVKIVAAAEKAEAKLPAKLKHVAALSPVGYGRVHRPVAHGATHRVAHAAAHETARGRHNERHVQRHVERRHRVHRQHTWDQYTRERHPPRHPDRARDRRRPRAHDGFAFEPHNRTARF